VLTIQKQIHESIFCFQSLPRVVLGISNPLPVNNTRGRYKLLLDINSSNAIYCSPGSHQDSEMLRRRRKARRDKTKQNWCAGKKRTPAFLLSLKTTFFTTALHWFPSVFIASRAILPHLVKPHPHDCLQPTDSHPVFHTALSISSTTASPARLTTASEGLLMPCQLPGLTRGGEVHAITLLIVSPSCFPRCSQVLSRRGLQYVYFPASLTGAKAWANTQCPLQSQSREVSPSVSGTTPPQHS